jgi:hypothetical protein
MGLVVALIAFALATERVCNVFDSPLAVADPSRIIAILIHVLYCKDQARTPPSRTPTFRPHQKILVAAPEPCSSAPPVSVHLHNEGRRYDNHFQQLATAQAIKPDRFYMGLREHNNSKTKQALLLASPISKPVMSLRRPTHLTPNSTIPCDTIKHLTQWHFLP